MFIPGHTSSFFVLLCLASFVFRFFGTRPDPFAVLTRILSLSRYSPRPFSDTHHDSTSFPVLTQTLLWYSPWFYPFPSTRPDRIPSLVLTRILPFFGTCPDTILSILDSPVLAPIQSPICFIFSDTHPDTISFPVLTRIRSFLSWILRYSPGFNPLFVSYSPVLARI